MTEPSPLGRPSNPDARARRREQILTGARHCFLRKGFHAATTAEISAEAGVSVANLYQYFPAKDDLVKALIEDDLAEDLALIAMVDSAASLRDGLTQVAQLVASDPGVAEHSRLKLEIIAEAARNPEIGAVVAAADAQMRKAMVALLERRQGAGEIRRDVELVMTAKLILALYDGIFARLAFVSEDAEALSRAADEMIINAIVA
jgi:TetR/AcrR family transcriptional regulator, repressor for uid operon